MHPTLLWQQIDNGITYNKIWCNHIFLLWYCSINLCLMGDGMNHRICNGMQNILPVIVKTVGLVITESFHYLTTACCFFQPLEQLKYSHLRAPKPTPVLLISHIPKIFLHPFLVPCYWLKGLEHPDMALTLK